ncbi:hypothetical protein Pfo_028801, partial [Paulownia fortunei]
MCDSHGWPSSHSQYMFFFAVYFTLLTNYRIGVLFRKQMWIVGLVMWPLAVLTMYSRVYLGYHTVTQVFAGGGVGGGVGRRVGSKETCVLQAGGLMDWQWVFIGAGQDSIGQESGPFLQTLDHWKEA